MADLKIKTQKIIKVGNSLAVTLDRKFLDRCRLQEGSDLIAKYDEDTASVTFATPDTYAASQGRPLQVAEQKAVYKTKFDPEFLAWVENFLQEDKEALDKLANL
jgi:antitoxin component of MazEF toxin-antitoxin module